MSSVEEFLASSILNRRPSCSCGNELNTINILSFNHGTIDPTWTWTMLTGEHYDNIPYRVYCRFVCPKCGKKINGELILRCLGRSDYSIKDVLGPNNRYLWTSDEKYESVSHI